MKKSERVALKRKNLRDHSRITILMIQSRMGSRWSRNRRKNAGRGFRKSRAR